MHKKFIFDWLILKIPGIYIYMVYIYVCVYIYILYIYIYIYNGPSVAKQMVHFSGCLFFSKNLN